MKQSNNRAVPHAASETDETIMGSVKAGNPNDIKPLYARYAALVFHIASESLDAGTAEDIVQEVFLAVWRNAKTFDPARGSFRSWLLQIAHFKVLNELRRRSRRPQLNPESDEAPLDELPDERSGPVEATWRSYREEAIRAAVDRLPAKQKQALSLAFFEDLTHDQIAQTLKLPVGTVKTRIRSAMQRLRLTLVPVIVLVIVAGIFTIILSRAEPSDLTRRALTMTTSSDFVLLHLTAAPGQKGGVHGSYRHEPGKGLGVLAFHEFPQALPGKTYQGWVLVNDRWISLGTALPDDNGENLLVGDEPELGLDPQQLRVTIEQLPGSKNPQGPVVIQWIKP